jgi:hypothetical protein
MSAGKPRRDRPPVRRVAVPERVLEAKLLDRVDYADAFWTGLEEGDLEQLTAFSRAVFGVPPGWVRALFRLRNVIVLPFGLRTSVGPAPEWSGGAPKLGDRVGLFSVAGLGADEIVLGEDDRHLDFRVSVLRHEEGGRQGVVVTTVVRFRNLLGRAYFVFVKPFHRLVVPAMIRRGVEAVDSPSGSSCPTT